MHRPTSTSFLFDSEVYIYDLAFIFPILVDSFSHFTQISLENIFQILLETPNGASLIEAYVKNKPHQFQRVCEEICNLISKCKSNQNIISLLENLSKLSLYCANYIRRLLTQKKLLPSLIIELTLSIEDEVSFLLGTLPFLYDFWMKAYFVENQMKEGTPAQQLRKKMLSLVNKMVILFLFLFLFFYFLNNSPFFKS